MNKKIYLIILLLTCRICEGQNLVPNGSFEQFSTCPSSEGKLDSALFWLNPSIWPVNGGSPDYFNQCCSNPYYVSVPNNYLGFQQAHSGVAYCGLLVGGLSFIGDPYNWREYAEVPLTTPLTANGCYYFQMYINLANNVGYTSDAIGVYFSNGLISGIPNHDPLPVSPQININLGFITDSVNWIHITGSYVANGGEDYLIIGNFKDSSQTNNMFIYSGALYNYSYFYIDDVSLSPCTGIEQQNANTEIKIYPNLFNDKLNIKVNNNELSEIILYDIASRKLMQKEFVNSVSLNTEQLAKGLYLYEVRSRNGSCKKGKVVKD